MKNTLALFLLAFTLFACSKTEDLNVETTQFASDQYPQKWELVSMSGNIANAKLATGTAMAWQEHYLLNADGSFTKTRVQNGKPTEASGTFSLESINGESYLVFTYQTKSPIIGSCSSDLTEVVAIRSSDSMYSTWLACDGPGLEYKRVK
jgi:hypothetical protein